MREESHDRLDDEKIKCASDGSINYTFTSTWKYARKKARKYLIFCVFVMLTPL